MENRQLKDKNADLIRDAFKNNVIEKYWKDVALNRTQELVRVQRRLNKADDECATLNRSLKEEQWRFRKSTEDFKTVSLKYEQLKQQTDELVKRSNLNLDEFTQILSERDKLTELLTTEIKKTVMINDVTELIELNYRMQNLLRVVSKQKSTLAAQNYQMIIEAMQYKKTIKALQVKNVKLMDELAICKPIYTQIELPD